MFRAFSENGAQKIYDGITMFEGMEKKGNCFGIGGYFINFLKLVYPQLFRTMI